MSELITMSLFSEMGELLGGIFLWVMLLPVFCIVATPIILVFASLQSCPPDYRWRVAEMYRSVFEFWLELGTWF